MRTFDFAQPASIPEALELLARHGEDARVLAGGQSLLILLRQRLVAPEVIVDVKSVPGLASIGASSGGLRLGATATYASVARSPEVRTDWPLLAMAAGSVGSMHIRERGTIGGAVSHADPAGDVLVALMALDATVTAVGAGGAQAFSADEFPTGLFTTRLAPGSLVDGVDVPVQPAEATVGYERFLLREGEFPLCQAAVRLEWDDGMVRAARVAVGGGFDRPRRLPEVEQWLEGTAPGEALAADFARRVRERVRPYADVRGSADWKARVVAAIAGRALRQALDGKGRADA